MWFIRYKVKCRLVSNIEDGTIFEEGLVKAENYTEATRILEDFYGNDLIEILLLRYIDNTLILSKETLDKIEEEVNDGIKSM